MKKKVKIFIPVLIVIIIRIWRDIMDQNLQFLNAIYYVNKEEKDMLVQQLNIINTTLSNINKELTLQNKLSICGNPNFSQDERIKALNDAKNLMEK